MKISYNWLKSFLDIDLTPDEVAHLLTSTGLETEAVESWESLPGGLKGVVIGEVVECVQHPDADKLKVCRVDVGEGEPRSIVCGAPNVAAGQKVPVALAGTTLMPFGKSEGITLTKTKIRGQFSEGMICAEDELGIGPSHDGIMVLDPEAIPGTPAADYFKVATDTVFEIGLTPNRTDAMSHYGVARDLRAALSFRNSAAIPLIPPVIRELHQIRETHPVPVEIVHHDACKRYTGITLTDVKVGESPGWIKDRLRAIGIKPHNNIVDITNYVLHELGHPLHAFDYNKIAGHRIVVHRLAEGTPFVTLDEIGRKLSADDLMICDAEKPLCIAGVYGGIHSGVTAETTTVFLESAWFDPVSIRRSAKHHGLGTDASFRFERGTDPAITITALLRAATLICETTGARVSSQLVDVGEYTTDTYSSDVEVSYPRVEEMIGTGISPSDLKRILQLLDFEIISEMNGQLLLKVPSYRFDVTREIDVIEEILRIYGMDNIPIPGKLAVSFPPDLTGKSHMVKEKVSGYLAANGFFEVWNNSLTSSEYAELAGPSNDAPALVKILNPLSQDLDVLRQTLLFGMMETAQYNMNRQWENIRIFEFGAEYHRNPGKSTLDPVTGRFTEKPVLCLLISGAVGNESWYRAPAESGFFELKASLGELFAITGWEEEKLILKEEWDSRFEYGAVYKKGEEILASFGSIHPIIRKHFSIRSTVYYAEINWEALTFEQDQRQDEIHPLPKYPGVRRDLSLVIDTSVKFNTIRHLIRKADERLIRDIILFDVYQGENLPEGRKSYAIGIMLQDMGKTLSEAEIERVMNRVIDLLARECGAELR